MALRDTGRNLGAVMSGSVSTTDRRCAEHAGSVAAVRAAWTSTYLRTAGLLDCLCALVAGAVVAVGRLCAPGGGPPRGFFFFPGPPVFCVGAGAGGGGGGSR